MRTVTLSRTGLQVSQVGMGGIPLARPAEAEAVKMIQHGLGLGANSIWELWPLDRFFSSDCVQCGESESKYLCHLPVREVIVVNLGSYERVASQHHAP